MPVVAQYLDFASVLENEWFYHLVNIGESLSFDSNFSFGDSTQTQFEKFSKRATQLKLNSENCLK